VLPPASGSAACARRRGSGRHTATPAGPDRTGPARRSWGERRDRSLPLIPACGPL
jgi:hypothetical protein